LTAAESVAEAELLVTETVPEVFAGDSVSVPGAD